jgi:hypothetical protein
MKVFLSHGLVLLAVVLLAGSVFGQTQTAGQAPASDPQALALASQAIAGLTGGASLRDVTLTGTETHIAGSLTETSPVTLKAMGTDNARVDRQLSTTFEIRTNLSGIPAGSWTGADGASHLMAEQNCWTDAAWFFPVFSSAFSFNKDVRLAYVGLETLSDVSVQHIRASRVAFDKSGNPVAMIAGWSQVDAYLDAQSLLPIDVRFNVYPDNDTNVRIPVEIIYSDYRVVNGIHVPFHIQKYLQNVLNLDLTITSATFNSGLSSSNFQVQ